MYLINWKYVLVDADIAVNVQMSGVTIAICVKSVQSHTDVIARSVVIV